MPASATLTATTGDTRRRWPRGRRRGKARALQRLECGTDFLRLPVPRARFLFEAAVDDALHVPGDSARCGAGGSRSTAEKISGTDVPLNGCAPVVILYNSTPSAQMSVRGSVASPRTCSGAIA